jgi:MFS transporter, DHA1 family, inner membrane transport protein
MTSIQVQSDPVVSAGRIVVLILTLSMMLGVTNQFGLSALLADVSSDLDVSVPLLGQVTTLVFFGAAFIGLFAGPIADQFGKRRVLVAGMIIVLLSCLGTSLAPSYGWLLVTRLGASFSGGILTGTTLAIAGTLFTGTERKRAMGTVVSGNAIAGIFAVPGMAMGASLASWRVSYVALGVVALLMIPFIYRLLPDDRIVDAGGVEFKKILEAYRPLLAQRSMVVLYGSNLTRAVGWAGTINYLGGFFSEEKGLVTGWIGMVFMAIAIGYLVGAKLAGSEIVSGEPRRVCSVATVVMAGFLGLAIVLPIDPLAATSLLMIGAFAGGLGYVMLVTLISTESQAGQGTTMSLNAALFAFGTGIGTLLGGAFLALGGYALLGIGLMLFSIASAVLVWHPVAVSGEFQQTPGATP